MCWSNLLPTWMIKYYYQPSVVDIDIDSVKDHTFRSELKINLSQNKCVNIKV